MSFWQDLYDFCVQETDMERVPDSISISCEKRDEFDKFRVSPTWMVEKQKSDVFGSVLLDEDEPEDDEIIEWPQTRYMTLEDDELYHEATKVFFEAVSLVNIGDASVEGITIFGPENEHWFVDSCPSVRLQLTNKKAAEAYDDVRSEVAIRTQELDKTVSGSDVLKFEALLSDRDVNSVVSCYAKILTQRPSEYFKDINDVKEAAEAVADSEEDEHRIVNSDGYVAMFAGRDSEEYDDEDRLSNLIEKDIRETFEETVSSELDMSVEGERWSVNFAEAPDGYYSFASGFADCEDVPVGCRDTMFWVHYELPSSKIE